MLGKGSVNRDHKPITKFLMVANGGKDWTE